jgi:hypothetical protein
MIERTLAFTQTQTLDSFYFQLYPMNLRIIGADSIVPPPGTTYIFSIIKGQQKFDENKIPTEADFRKVDALDVMIFSKCQLNFYLPNFSKGKKI